ncbi:MAG TPA: TetR/AcrR family transcriptional regulator [Jiangellaceae bacterium]
MSRNRKQPDPARRSERSRQAILTATADLIGEIGYTKLAIEAIAARAGVGKQTIYRWWPDKGSVVLDAYLALVGADQGIDLPDSGDLETDLRLVLGSMVDSLADPIFERRYRALLTAIQDDPELAAALLDRLLKPWLEATKRRLRGAQQAGQIRDVDLDVAAESLYGPIYYRWLLRIGAISRQYVDTLIAMNLRALT